MIPDWTGMGIDFSKSYSDIQFEVWKITNILVTLGGIYRRSNHSTQVTVVLK